MSKIDEAELVELGWSQKNRCGDTLHDTETAERVLAHKLTFMGKTVYEAGEWKLPTFEAWKNDEAEQEYAKSQRRYFHSDADRYFFDMAMCRSENGWKQYDTNQDAWYFGIWVNLSERQIVTYAEGDLDVEDCADDAALAAKLKEMEECYGDPPPAFKSICTTTGQATEFYDTRPAVGE
jgi:hypothetical protein